MRSPRVQLAVIVVAVLVLVAGVYAFMSWQRNAPTRPVEQLRVYAMVDGETHEIAPYTICPFDEQCDGGEPPVLPLPSADEMTFRVDPELASTSWRLLLIYDDPAENEELLHQSGEASEATIDARTASGATLLVAEISALEIAKDDQGEETPVVATWSVAFEQAQPAS